MSLALDEDWLVDYILNPIKGAVINGLWKFRSSLLDQLNGTEKTLMDAM